MAFQYNPSALVSALGSVKPTEELKYARGGGLLTGLLSGMNAYAGVRGAGEQQEQQRAYNQAISSVNPMISGRQFGQASGAVSGVDPELARELAMKQAEEDRWNQEQAGKTSRAVIMSPTGKEAPTEYEKAFQKLSAEKTFSDISSAETAKNRLSLYDQMKSDLVKSDKSFKGAEDVEASTGMFGGLKRAIGSATGVGVDKEEAAARSRLNTTGKQLALQFLQSFKGPTTDFEYGVAQSLAEGRYGSPAEQLAAVKVLEDYDKRQISTGQKNIAGSGQVSYGQKEQVSRDVSPDVDLRSKYGLE